MDHHLGTAVLVFAVLAVAVSVAVAVLVVPSMIARSSIPGAWAALGIVGLTLAMVVSSVRTREG